MKVANFNGCKVYNLSSGKTMPDWLSQSKKRSLSKDVDYQKRVELIQDFEMPTASQCLAMSKDHDHIIVTGTYPPIVKCFTTHDLAMKFQRGLTAEVVSLQLLSDDFSKFVVLQNDRTLNFHAPYGTHYSCRIPRFGRHVKYNWENCDLLISSSSNEIYRLNLETGQFREPCLLSSFDENSGYGVNKIDINPIHQLIGCGSDYQGIVEFWDPRQRKQVSILQLNDNENGGSFSSHTAITALSFDTDGLTLGVGTNNGNCYIYDIRSKKPLYIKEHQYGLPIIDIHYHHNTKSIISSDKKIIKIWEREGDNIGKIITNIETSSDINDILFVNDRRGETGLIMIAGEQSRIMTYFIPTLGPAPRWCSFLENLTEELEETASSSNIYEDYKFITKVELSELGALSLLGTPMLKAYMHGFFIDMKLYNKLRAVSKPFEYEEYRKQKLKEKIDEKRGSRISVIKKVPKVNKELAEKLIKKSLKDEAKEGGIEGETITTAAGGGGGKKVLDAKKLIDSRFAAVFEREEFQQDENDYEYKLRNPVQSKFTIEQQQRRKELGEDEGDLYEEIEGMNESEQYENKEDSEDDYDGSDIEDEDDEEGEDHPNHYNDLSDEDDNADQEVYSGSENDDDKELSNKMKKRKRKEYGDTEEMGAIEKATLKSKLKKQQQQQKKNMKMFTLNDSIESDDILFSNKQSLKALKKEEQLLSSLPIQKRLEQLNQSNSGNKGTESTGNRDVSRYNKKGSRSWVNKGKDDKNTQIKVYKNKEEGTIREISFFPKK
jgi:ribosome biogenesis protein ENP2